METEKAVQRSFEERCAFARERLIQASPRIQQLAGSTPDKDDPLVGFYTRWVVMRYPKEVDVAMAGQGNQHTAPDYWAHDALYAAMVRGPLAYLALPEDRKAAIRHQIADQYRSDPEQPDKMIRPRQRGEKIRMFDDLAAFATDPDLQGLVLDEAEQQRASRLAALGRRKTSVTR